MPLSAAEIEDNTIKLTSFIFFYLLLTTSIYEASGACETLVRYEISPFYYNDDNSSMRQYGHATCIMQWRKRILITTRVLFSFRYINSQHKYHQERTHSRSTWNICQNNTITTKWYSLRRNTTQRRNKQRYNKNNHSQRNTKKICSGHLQRNNSRLQQTWQRIIRL